MNKLNNTILNKRLPSLFGFFFLALSIGTITWLSSNAILFGTKAAVDATPQNIQTSNITDTSFTVSYLTSDTVPGTINFGENGQRNQIALDDRDQGKGVSNAYKIHSITIKNLKPETNYTFSITSGDKTVLNKNIPFTVTTGPKLTETPQDSLVQGEITLDDGSTPTDALVFVSSSTSQLFSTLVNADGTYKIDLATLRDKTLTAFIPFDPDLVLQLKIIDATKKSQATIPWSSTDPVPLIILSKNYDFVTSTLPLEPSPIASEAAFPTNEEATTTTTPQIITPKKEQAFTDQQPVFRGKAVPNETVTITINSEQTITATVQADSNGNWQYRPTTALAPGAHTITMRTTDAEGLVRVITQSFVVYAEGSKFTEPSISPSQTITPTPIKSKPTPTTKPTITTTPKLTQTLTPTEIVATPSATKTPTNQPTIKQTTTVLPTKPPIPVTGNTAFIATVGGIIATISIGALLFFFTVV